MSVAHLNQGLIHKFQRRGAALLVVLAILLITTASVVVLADTVSSALLSRRLAIETRNVDAMLVTADEIILDWLSKESTSIVLPPEVESPRVEVIHDTLLFDDAEVTLQITAWDQCGMAPIDALHSGAPFRLAVSDYALKAVEIFQTLTNVPMGLDLIDPKDEEITVFPTPVASIPNIYHLPNAISTTASNQFNGTDHDSQLAVGELVASHNESNAINVNTAPLALVERALLEAGRGGLEMIEMQRREGKPVTLDELPSVPHEENQRDRNSIRLTGASDSWSFRVDIQVGILSRSWWCVYQRMRSKWQLTQRLIIDE